MSKPHLSFGEYKWTVTQHMSRTFELEGFSPLVGKIFGLLLFAPKPVSLQEIADQLGVTKAAVSVQVRALEKYSMCQKIPMRSDRKDYYYIADDFTLISMRASKQKIESITNQCEELLSTLKGMSQIDEAEKESFEVSKRRFAEVSAMYRMFLSRLEGIEEEWIRLREQL
ncbi:GbsR/MarR family transcriptional regulator [Paenibacillus tyrfis]|uniref:GbsR/MarR family transcriptional regulator n=1 Tax=Paenibacillus tyrfis TaxID=1501230 RepID=UPI0020A07753|nr:MarR family transcriptional regulator [Paenibacillus tyrfis]MCP1309229.1 HTH domain-containing protein [Paenibacillus tyrfis]